MNYFSVKQISDLLLKHGFEIDRILREESPNDLELGKRKLIVLSHNTKH